MDLDKEVDNADKNVMSDPKSNGMILPVGDVPRQISKDSGRGSLSPTSTHGQPIIDNLEKEQALKEMLKGGIFPPGYSKATIVANHCLQGNVIFNLHCAETYMHLLQLPYFSVHYFDFIAWDLLQSILMVA